MMFIMALESVLYQNIDNPDSESSVNSAAMRLAITLIQTAEFSTCFMATGFPCSRLRKPI